MEKLFSYQLSLNDRLEQLVNNEYTADVFFKVGEPKELMFAHRNIITTSSEVFYAQFNGQFNDAKTNSRENPIIIEDIQPKVFLQILRFMYCEKVDLNCDILVELYYATKKYMLAKLSEICEEFVIKAEDGVLKIFNDNRRFEIDQINSVCLNVIRDNPLKCFSNNFLLNLDRKSMEMIMESTNINCHEIHMQEAIQKWMKYNNIRSEDSSSVKMIKNIRDLHCKKLYAFSGFQYSTNLVTDITVDAADTFNLYGFGIFIGTELTNSTSVKLSAKIEFLSGPNKNCISEVKKIPLKDELYIHEMIFERITMRKGTRNRIEIKIEADDQPMPSMFYLNNFQPACPSWEEFIKLTYTTSAQRNCLAYLLYNDNKSNCKPLLAKNDHN